MRSNAPDVVANRRSCRRYVGENVDRELMDTIMRDMENVPTGCNSMTLEMTVIDDIEALIVGYLRKVSSLL